MKTLCFFDLSMKGDEMSGKKALFLSALLFLAFALFSLLFNLNSVPEGSADVRARAGEAEALMTGRDDADREPLELLPGETVNINTATQAQLQKLPGIGEVLAEAIIEYREANGPFESIEELTEVNGIGEGRFEAVADQITVGEP